MVDGATNSAEQMLYGTLLILTFVSGLVDAASFLALGHVFTANMTVAGLAFDSSIAGGANAKWRIRVAAISTIFLGAVAGALVLRHSLVDLLGLSALLVTSCAVLQLFRETSHEVKLKGAT